ncbi:tetratricopeptide repeat protein [Nocardia abscessus]|uniref:tetratricopeptide repeat protein n=1 Tax=Nocardia abscessus TaxID=120957 RepID=UPI00245405E5|nr:tetratricopeptide repeat protein [Nocardia abscessus]
MIPSPSSGQLLAAYSDLCSDTGPIHARVAADFGTRLQTGAEIPANQAMPPLHLRASITLDEPSVPYLEDPRRLPTGERSGPWQILCRFIDEWYLLGPAQQLRVARVVAKLAFWKFLAELIQPDDLASRTSEALALSYLRVFARCQLDPQDIQSATQLAEIGTIRATNDQLPLETRLAAAVNLTVHYVRKQRDDAEVRKWSAYAERLWSSPDADRLPWILKSAYWRGVSFIPYRTGDHKSTAQMLDRAEDCAVEALEQATDGDRIIALENFHPLLETRGRAAWDAGDLVMAEKYYQRLVDHDPLDSKAHIRLADFFRETGRNPEARKQYLEAAGLGAPCSLYARGRLREYI